MSGLLCCSRLGYIAKLGIGLVKSKIKNGKPSHPDDRDGIDKPNIRILARRGGFKRISGIIYEETPKSYVGHDGEGHNLERYWTFNFLREAETILNKSDYTRLRTKERVKTSKKEKVYNVDYYYESNEELTYIIRKSN
ncbi:hypothetical protein RhiirA5_383008 [Rhizophagus irregularis]|uniref:Uncharacterized protein n=1 Tax=Rhizophagus irregularis TaxID=588596 RepID=A0A2N0NYR0_9GLOM|nr:hypothetical protein RhiirA5_383008 [Rhizophagus irregularis]